MASRGYPLCAVGDVVENFDRLRVPVSSRERAKRRGAYPYYGASGIIDRVDGFLFDGLYVLVGEDGTVQDEHHAPFVQLVNGRFWVSNHAHVLRAKGGRESDTLYLAYALRTLDVRPYVTGSVQPKLSQTNLNQLLVPWPEDANVRAQIAAMLGVVDQKIGLNSRIVERSRALLGAMFEVAFETDTPRLSTLKDLADVIDCLHAKKPARVAMGRTMIQVENLRNDGLLDLAKPFLISEDDYQRWTSRIEVKPGDCVITNVGRVGAVAQVPEGLMAAIGRNMTAIRPKDGVPVTYLLQALLSRTVREEIRLKTDSGTILDALNVRSIPGLQLPTGDRADLERFEADARPLRRMMEMRVAQTADLRRSLHRLARALVAGDVAPSVEPAA